MSLKKTDRLLAIAIIRNVRAVSQDLRTMDFPTWADKLDRALLTSLSDYDPEIECEPHCPDMPCVCECHSSGRLDVAIGDLLDYLDAVRKR